MSTYWWDQKSDDCKTDGSTLPVSLPPPPTPDDDEQKDACRVIEHHEPNEEKDHGKDS